MAQWLIEGLTATISGVLTVFLVLIVIAFLISQLRHIEKMGFKKRERAANRKKVEANTSFRVPEVPEKKEDDLELIAVITAAVASSLNTTADKLVVRSIRRMENSRRKR